MVQLFTSVRPSNSNTLSWATWPTTDHHKSGLKSYSSTYLVLLLPLYTSTGVCGVLVGSPRGVSEAIHILWISDARDGVRTLASHMERTRITNWNKNGDNINHNLALLLRYFSLCCFIQITPSSWSKHNTKMKVQGPSQSNLGIDCYSINFRWR